MTALMAGSGSPSVMSHGRSTPMHFIGITELVFSAATHLLLAEGWQVWSGLVSNNKRKGFLGSLLVHGLFF